MFLNLKAINGMPISMYSVINLSRIIFSIILSIIILGEQLTITILIGIIIVILGLILVNNKSEDEIERKNTNLKIVWILLIACLLNAISSILDKKLLTVITSEQLQFWALLFLTIFYWLILLIKKERIKVVN